MLMDLAGMLDAGSLYGYSSWADIATVQNSTIIKRKLFIIKKSLSRPCGKDLKIK